MGIYPDERWTRSTNRETGQVTATRVLTLPGLAVTEVYALLVEIEDMTDCFCCSCWEDDGYVSRDPYCRNHGFAGERPCERHQMVGHVDKDGVMPDSVETERTRQQARHG